MRMPSREKRALLIAALCLASCGPRPQTRSGDGPPPATLSAAGVAVLRSVAGATVYVPVYSHIHHQSGEPIVNLAATVSVRNADPEGTLVLLRVDYHGSRGQLIEGRLETPVVLPPLASTHFVVGQEDVRGGAGASFLVEWVSESALVDPVVEAVMIGTSGQQGISFTSRGRVVARLQAPPG